MLDNSAVTCGSICMRDNCTLVNVHSVYSGNVVTDDGAAAIYGKRWCNITNVQTTFEYNSGIDGIIKLKDYGSVFNNLSTFR